MVEARVEVGWGQLGSVGRMRAGWAGGKYEAKL